ncbi:hypothetical protein QUB78_03290 [Microcoleus sp. ARI1-A4]|uniref:hypothetical protein n=1 Tax=Microcoleus sp. ARI1-A1 TaxID=2818556 RepID=UPI002FD44FB5
MVKADGTALTIAYSLIPSDDFTLDDFTLDDFTLDDFTLDEFLLQKKRSPFNKSDRPIFSKNRIR